MAAPTPTHETLALLGLTPESSAWLCYERGLDYLATCGLPAGIRWALEREAEYWNWWVAQYNLTLNVFAHALEYHKPSPLVTTNYPAARYAAQQIDLTRLPPGLTVQAVRDWVASSLDDLEPPPPVRVRLPEHLLNLANVQLRKA